MRNDFENLIEYITINKLTHPLQRYFFLEIFCILLIKIREPKMQVLLNLPKNQRKVFSKHFLLSVHANFICSKLLSNEIFKHKEYLTSTLKSEGFDICNDIIQSQFSLTKVKSQPSPVASQTAKPIGLKFIDSSNKLELSIQNAMIAVSDTNYQGMEAFIQRLKLVLDIIFKVLDIKPEDQIEKVGLRKINSIIIKPVSNFSTVLNIFNPSLFSIARSGLLSLETFKITEEATLLENDHLACVLKTKLQRQDINSLTAYLDFDLMAKTNISVSDLFAKTLPELNQTHFDLFMWSVTKELLDLME